MRKIFFPLILVALYVYGHGAQDRQPWYSCSCCPTNYCRFLPQLGNFCYRSTADMLAIDIPVAADIDTDNYAVDVTGGYPYDGCFNVTFRKGGKFTLAVRIPSWCEGRMKLPEGGEIVNGYWRATREWKAGERLSFSIEMVVRRVVCRAPADSGKVALMRGPLVYCVELPADADFAPYELTVPAVTSFNLVPVDGLQKGTLGIRFNAIRRIPARQLYSNAAPMTELRTVTAIPYALWQNRGPVQMNVFLNDGR